MADIKAPWQGCPKTHLDGDNVCRLVKTSIDLFLLVYVKYTCAYKCPGPAGVEIETSHTHNRLFFFIDWED